MQLELSLTNYLKDLHTTLKAMIQTLAAVEKVKKYDILMSFSNHFSLTSMENVLRSRKDVKEDL